MTDAALDWEDAHAARNWCRLAAVTNELKRVVIIRSDLKTKLTVNLPYSSPGNRENEGDVVADYEGCLSIKVYAAKCRAILKIRLKALDQDGNEIPPESRRILSACHPARS